MSSLFPAPMVAQAPSIPILSPEIKAGLMSIRDAEGTWKPGQNPEDGYKIMFGGGTYDNTKEHPNKVVCKGKYCSAAAGAYQFMPGTWGSVGGGVMTPERQDWGATRLWLAREGLPQNQHGVNLLTQILAKNKGISLDMSNKMAPEWASFPTYAGVSYYGQPVKPLSRINQTYHSTLPGFQKEEQVSKASQARIDKGDVALGTMAIKDGMKKYYTGKDLGFQTLDTIKGNLEKKNYFDKNPLSRTFKNLTGQKTGLTIK